MPRTIVKWIDLRGFSTARVIARVAAIRETPPARVPRIVSYGLCGQTLRLETVRIENASNFLSRPFPMPEQEVLRFRQTLRSTLAQWHKQGFRHGDLSPRNILFTAAGEAWFIDWVPDLESRMGTPLFAHPDLRRGRRTAAADGYAADRIIEWCCRGGSMVFPKR